MKKKSKTISKIILIPTLGILVFIFYILFIELLLNYSITLGITKDFNLKKIQDSNFLNTLENISFDLIMKIKNFGNKLIINKDFEKLQFKNVSSDILIIGIDEKSLNTMGGGLFRRYYLSNFIESIKKNKNVIFDYPASDDPYENKNEKKEMQKRIDSQIKEFGELRNISGSFQDAVQFNSLTLSLIPYIDNLKNMGPVNTVEDNDKIIRKYPLITKSYITDNTNFSHLQEGDYYDVVDVEGYKISYNDDNYYYLAKSNSRVFEQMKLHLKDRKNLTKNNIYTIKDRMDKISNDFQLELDNFKAKFEKQNKEIIIKIKNHLSKSDMSDGYKEQISQVFELDENLKDIDELLYDLGKKLNNLSTIDKKIKNEALFFNDLYDQCIKIDRKDKNNIYDYLYKDKTVYFNILQTASEKYFMSIPLILVCEYYHVNKDDVEVIYGKEIKLKNPLVFNPDTEKLEKPKNIIKDYVGIPIDNKGFIQINYAGFGSTVNSTAKNSTTFKVVSYADFILGTKQYLIQNKILMIGAFAKGMTDDVYQTPFKSMFGIEILANTINTMIMNYFIIKPSSLINILLLLFISIIVVIITSNNNLIRACIYTILFIALSFGFTVVLFSFTNITLEIVRIIIISLLSLISVIVYRALTEEKQKKMIKRIYL